MNHQKTENNKWAGTVDAANKAFIKNTAILSLLICSLLGAYLGTIASKNLMKSANATPQPAASLLAEAGTWENYAVDSDGGFYNITLNAASPFSGRTIVLACNETVIATVEIPNTGSSESLQPVTLRNVEVPACINGTLRASFEDGGVHLASIEMKTGFESWLEQYPGLSANPALDSDSDGVNNLYEYMTGGDPLDASDSGYQPVLRERIKVVYALADDPRIQHQPMQTTRSLAGRSTSPATYVGSEAFGEHMRTHLSVFSEHCSNVSLQLDYAFETAPVQLTGL